MRIKVAVAHPCDDVSLRGAIEAYKLGLIEPILVAPPERLGNVAKEAHLDISGFELVASAHSHNSAAKAVGLVTAGRVEALMKGSLHTDEIMGAVVAREGGIRTERRISHCFIMDVPSHPDPLIITDAAVNIAPDLDAKVDIVQNAIDLAHAMGAPEVRVAILSAMETVTAKVPSTIEAAALCKMAERGQITGALLDGPLALDNAISPEAAAIKKIVSPVAGRANILVVPDLEAGNMLAKSLSFLAEADAAGIVLGARVPIILTSRADSLSDPPRFVRRRRNGGSGATQSGDLSDPLKGWTTVGSSYPINHRSIGGEIEPNLAAGRLRTAALGPDFAAWDELGREFCCAGGRRTAAGRPAARTAPGHLLRQLVIDVVGLELLVLKRQHLARRTGGGCAGDRRRSGDAERLGLFEFDGVCDVHGLGLDLDLDLDLDERVLLRERMKPVGGRHHSVRVGPAVGG